MRLFSASTLAIGIALFATPASAQALPDFMERIRFGNEIETILREAERAQNAGQCQLRDALLLTLKSTVEGQRAAQTPDAAKDDWRRRGQEILNRRCPGDSAPESPPPTMAAAPGTVMPTESVMDAMGETAPTRSSLDVLKERMDAQIAACDDVKAFGDAKRDLLAEIERRLGSESDRSRQIELRELYRRYATRMPPICTPRRSEDRRTGGAPTPREDSLADVPLDVKVRVFLDMLYASRFIPLRPRRRPPGGMRPVEVRVRPGSDR